MKLGNKSGWVKYHVFLSCELPLHVQCLHYQIVWMFNSVPSIAQYRTHPMGHVRATGGGVSNEGLVSVLFLTIAHSELLAFSMAHNSAVSCSLCTLIITSFSAVSGGGLHAKSFHLVAASRHKFHLRCIAWTIAVAAHSPSKVSVIKRMPLCVNTNLQSWFLSRLLYSLIPSIPSADVRQVITWKLAFHWLTAF